MLRKPVFFGSTSIGYVHKNIHICQPRERTGSPIATAKPRFAMKRQACRSICNFYIMLSGFCLQNGSGRARLARDSARAAAWYGISPEPWGSGDENGSLWEGQWDLATLPAMEAAVCQALCRCSRPCLLWASRTGAPCCMGAQGQQKNPPCQLPPLSGRDTSPVCGCT